MMQWEYDAWCEYNHEHRDENGNWVSDYDEDDEEENTYEVRKNAK